MTKARRSLMNLAAEGQDDIINPDLNLEKEIHIENPQADQQDPPEGVDMAAAMEGMEAEQTDLRDMQEQIAETEEVMDALSAVEDELTVASADSGVGITPSDAKVIEVVMEGFRRELGMPRKYSGEFPALENFGGKKSKREGAKMALEHVQGFRATTGKQLHIAQEGFFSRLGHSFKRVFQTSEKLSKRLASASQRYDSRELRDGDIPGPGWGRDLNPDNKSQVKSHDVVKLVAVINKEIHSKHFYQKLEETLTLYEKILTQLKRSSIISSDDAVIKINELGNELAKIADEISELADISRRKGADADFEPLQETDKKQLEKILSESLNDRELKALLALVDRVSWDVDEPEDINYRMSGGASADIQAARLALQRSHRILNRGYALLHTNIRIGFAAIRYMEDSVK